jgi:predicted ribosome-associated RNA-binding protein Tma20
MVKTEKFLVNSLNDISKELMEELKEHDCEFWENKKSILFYDDKEGYFKLKNGDTLRIIKVTHIPEKGDDGNDTFYSDENTKWEVWYDDVCFYFEIVKSEFVYIVTSNRRNYILAVRKTLNDAKKFVEEDSNMSINGIKTNKNCHYVYLKEDSSIIYMISMCPLI